MAMTHDLSSYSLFILLFSIAKVNTSLYSMQQAQCFQIGIHFCIVLSDALISLQIASLDLLAGASRHSSNGTRIPMLAKRPRLNEDSCEIGIIVNAVAILL